MISDYRPTPRVEYDITWDGTSNRQWQQRYQRQPPPVSRSTLARGVPATEVLLAALRTKASGRIWSVDQLVAATGLHESSVTTAIGRLRAAGLVCVERVDMGMGGAGAQIRVWLA